MPSPASTMGPSAVVEGSSKVKPDVERATAVLAP
jgi:hypothetical protein